MSPLKSSKGRNIGKLLKAFATSSLGQSFSRPSIEGLTGATGGNISGGYEVLGIKYHVFTNDTSGGALNFIAGSDGTVDILMVGGGGGAGAPLGAGGGAGGVIYWRNVPISNGTTYAVTVGAGGAESNGTTPAPAADPGYVGGNTTFNFNGTTVTAAGGGGGAPYNGTSTELNQITNGGSGGGGATSAPAPFLPGGSATQPGLNLPIVGEYVGTFNQYGNIGGDGPGDPHGAGGGGASQAGFPAAADPVNGSKGGDGIALPAFPSAAIAPAIPSPTRTDWSSAVTAGGYYGGGGGGGGRASTSNPRAGGIGGGGRGQQSTSTGSQAGVHGTGGGGGGGVYVPSNTPSEARGGNGIVVIRYIVRS
jgi:hypothetical protein